MKKEIVAGRQLENNPHSFLRRENAPCQRGFFMGGDILFGITNCDINLRSQFATTKGGDTMGTDEEYVMQMYDEGYDMLDEQARWFGVGDRVLVKDASLPEVPFEAEIAEIDGSMACIVYKTFDDKVAEEWVEIEDLEKI